MTDYIEEMMRTAGIEYYDRYYSCIENKDLECKDECCVCDKAKEVFCYPDFTPQKQLEMIKLIGKNKIGKHYHTLKIEQDEITNVYFLTFKNKEFSSKNICIGNSDFIQALAQLTTKLMKAGELDKEKVKEVLQ